ncbi:MAG TPA: PAS domain S-box protein [Chitinophagaceae bacterium]|nr:PAS domain S-box protein [Chitinophagaceae bacterium]
MAESALQKIDVVALLNALPGNYLILLPDAPQFTILGVTDAYLKATNKKRNELIGKSVFDAFTSNSQNGTGTVIETLRASLQYVIAHKTEHSIPNEHLQMLNTETDLVAFKTWRVIHKPVIDSSGAVEYIIQDVTDVSQQTQLHAALKNIEAGKSVEESETRFRSLINAAPLGIALFVGRSLIIEMPNQPFIDILGKGASIVGKPLAEVMPELHDQPFLKILTDVYATGKVFQTYETQVNIVKEGVLKKGYYDFSYTPLFDASGAVYAIMDISQDVTERVLARQALEESEQNLRNIILQAPVAMCILNGPQHLVEIANRRMLKLWGKQAEGVLYKPLFEGLPEAKNQGFEQLLHSVYTTGETFTANERLAKLPRNGKIVDVYVNFVYEPLRKGDGTIAGVMAVALDVTNQVLARQKIEEAEERARLAVDAADLGTYEIDLATNVIVASPRMEAIFEIGHHSERERYITALHKDDLAIRARAYEVATRTGQLEYDARLAHKDGSVHWIRVKGRLYHNEQNVPVWLRGVVQDITAQKSFEQELSKQVRERTIELERSNKELQRSNANLEEFAHAASHDLKEPIRTIHFFTDLLKDQLETRLNEKEKQTFGRIEKASRRMAQLIDDLLLYSHVSHRPQQKEAIDLNEKLNRVLEDLELDIERKKAVIKAQNLPIVMGYRRQLQQLFQNLISNALKYSKHGTPPHITITAKQVAGTDVPHVIADVEPEQTYYLIEVQDNGIGFEQNEGERIFQMFQRLHNNADYPGSGVGLSIVRKVVENHNGRIIAQSTPGKGSLFSIYLPAT